MFDNPLCATDDPGLITLKSTLINVHNCTAICSALESIKATSLRPQVNTTMYKCLRAQLWVRVPSGSRGFSLFYCIKVATAHASLLCLHLTVRRLRGNPKTDQGTHGSNLLAARSGEIKLGQEHSRQTCNTALGLAGRFIAQQLCTATTSLDLCSAVSPLNRVRLDLCRCRKADGRSLVQLRHRGGVQCSLLSRW